MSKYKGNYKTEYATTLMVTFFRNTIKYFKGTVSDEDYFTPICAIYDKKEMEHAIIENFSLEELVENGICDISSDEKVSFRSRRRRGGKYRLEGNSVYFEDDDITRALTTLWNDRDTNSRCRKMLLELLDNYIEKHKVSAEKDPLAERFCEIQRLFKLSEVEVEFLKYAYTRQTTLFSDYPNHQISSPNRDRVGWLNFCAMAMDHLVSEVNAECNENARLRKYDFLSDDFEINDVIRNYLDGQDDEPLQGRFFKVVRPKEVLPWDFYSGNLQQHGDVLKRIIKSKKAGEGVNILLYGATGTGKTSFAYTLAQELGLSIYEITHSKDSERHGFVAARMLGIQACNYRMPLGEGMMVVDEADQVLDTSSEGGLFAMFGIGRACGDSEKGAVNSMLDSITAPTIWISNANPSQMADSVRRRFDYSISFGEMTAKMRENIWRNNAKKLDMESFFSDKDYETYALDYPTNAGGITMVLKNLKAMKPKRSEVAKTIKSLMMPHCELMSVRKLDEKILPSRDYSLDGLNIKGDFKLDKIVGAVKKFYTEQENGTKDPDRPRMNILMWGAPGSGKTEFVKYLGKELGRKVSIKMGSDILSKYLGDTEQNLSNIFKEAEEEGAILFIDEIDGMAQDRSGAQRSWEVTQVNELLYQMENFNGVMIAATNFMDNLDRAIIRRFTFKLHFDYLDDSGKQLFFERFFKTKLSDEELVRLQNIRNLTPGDFRTVRQSMYYSCDEITNQDRIAELERECSLKRDTKSPQIGF